MKKLTLIPIVALTFCLALVIGPVAAWACGDTCQCNDKKTAQADDSKAEKTNADDETEEKAVKVEKKAKHHKKQAKHHKKKAKMHKSAKAGGDLVAQPGASVGDKTLCPVSGNEFTVTDSSPSVEHDGKKVYFCCAGCGDKFSEDPEGMLAKHVEKVEEAQKAE